ncbi:aldo/keto reductase [Streptomyces sp. NPDC050164]|uniref:aldo/keto reductase n=1 Tax=Streptomyces sp. NPDC050164 TaxID=3365605 RepID=UPI00379E912F
MPSPRWHTSALAALREEGLIRHLGISNVDVGHLAQARTTAPVVTVQNQGPGRTAGGRSDAQVTLQRGLAALQ